MKRIYNRAPTHTSISISLFNQHSDMQLPPHRKCYWHRLSLSRLANLSAQCQPRQSVQLKEGHHIKKRRVARRSSPLPLPSLDFLVCCSSRLNLINIYVHKLIIQLDVEFVVPYQSLVRFCFASGFVFVTKLLTNNNRQQNVWLYRSLSLSCSFFLYFYL